VKKLFIRLFVLYPLFTTVYMLVPFMFGRWSARGDTFERGLVCVFVYAFGFWVLYELGEWHTNRLAARRARERSA
jgi:lipopolysaccharide export LptBFGC system permease protein LptF